MIKVIRKNWIFIVMGAGIVLFLFFTREDDDLTAEEPEFMNDLNPVEDDINIEQDSFAIIDVKGEVKSPGVYEVDIHSRVNDVIKLAGGFSVHADELSVNLAQKVQDEMTIIVSEVGANANSNDDPLMDEKVKINNATQEEIETLAGIGPSKAQAIIQHRDDYGLFQTVEDLLEISGIGEKTLETIRDEIQIP